MNKIAGLLIIVFFLLTGCGTPLSNNSPTNMPSPPPVISTDSANSPSTEHTNPISELPETGRPDEEPVDFFQKLLERNSDNPWYNAAIGCIYSVPTEIDLSLLFYQGFPVPDGTPSDEEMEFLSAQGFADGIVEIHRLPVHKLEEVLEKYFGTTLSDVRIPDNWLYYEKTDCYYSSHNDAYIVSGFTVTNVECDNSIISVYYTLGPNGTEVIDPVSRTPVSNAVLSLKETGDGRYTVLSNVVLREKYLGPIWNTKMYEYTVNTDGLDSESALNEAALALSELYLKDMMTESDDRTFRITTYRNLNVHLKPTISMDTETAAIYRLQDYERNEHCWIMEIDVEFQYEGTLSPVGSMENVWIDTLYQSSPIGFLVRQDGHTFTMQSRAK